MFYCLLKFLLEPKARTTVVSFFNISKIVGEVLQSWKVLPVHIFPPCLYKGARPLVSWDFGVREWLNCSVHD